MFEYNQSNFFKSSLFPSKIPHGFGTKALGSLKSSEEVYNLIQMYEPLAQSVVIPEQVHGDMIHFVDKMGNGLVEIPQCDGLVTSLKNTALTIKTADCVPIIYADTKNHIIGISHNGWKGTYLRLAEKMIKKMVERGANLSSIQVAIGPAIGACCYSIDEERAQSIIESLKENEKHAVQKNEQGYSLNLLTLNTMQFLNAGLQKNQIDTFPFCTKCDEKRLFSYRRSREARELLDGQMRSYVMMK
jgi:YfiH family protein